MADINIMVERCLTQLNHIDNWIVQVRREHQMLISQLGSLKEQMTDQKGKNYNNSNAGVAATPEVVEPITYVLRILEQYKRPLNINEISGYFQKDYPDVIPTQIINIKNYLYRHIRKGLQKGTLSQYNINGGIRTDYVPSHWLMADGSLMI